MRDFILRRLRRAPVIKSLWDEYERMLVAHETAQAERDRALVARDQALAERDKAIDARDLAVAERDAALKAFGFRESLPYMAEVENGMRFWLLSGDRYVSPAIAKGIYEPVETAFVRREAKAGMAAVDIGANLGWFTVHLAKLVGLTGRVDAFEPRADLALLLTRSAAENRLSNVVIHGYALGAEEGDGQMIWLREDSNPGGTNLVGVTITDPAVMAQPVHVRTLDSCIEHRIDFIKIDVEGAEPLVLSGAQRILTKDRPILLVEINAPNLSRTSNISAAEFGSYVDGLGYRLHELLPDGSRGRRLTGCDLAAVDMLVNVAMVPQERA